MTRIFIADDHVLILEGLKKILREESDMIVVGEAQNAVKTLERIGKSECDILLLDLSLPDKSGLDVLKEIKKRFPRLRVLILSMFPEEMFAVRALKAGADGYLTKDSAAKELVVALRKVATAAGQRQQGDGTQRGARGDELTHCRSFSMKRDAADSMKR